MNKSDFPLEHIERINFAIREGLSIHDWELIDFIDKGFSGVPVYKIKVLDKLYIIKFADINDPHLELIRHYKIIKAVSKQGISPQVYFTNVQHGLILMEYFESKRHPKPTPALIEKLAKLIRDLHDNNSLSKRESINDWLEQLYQKLPAKLMKKDIIKRCMQKIKTIDNIIFDDNDIRLCHCDLNQNNILFDGEQYKLIDWERASSQSFYLDLAYCATGLFYNEDSCTSFLNYYLGREASEKEKSKYYLMRIFAFIDYGISLLSAITVNKPNISILKNSKIKKLPKLLPFIHSLRAGDLNFTDAIVQQQLVFIYLQTAEEMMNQSFQHAFDLLSESK